MGVLRIHLLCNNFVLDKRILHVAKCTKVQYLVDFLRVELKLENLFLSLHNQTLFTDSLLFDYPILNNDTLVVNCTGLLGGASWKCESCKLEFFSQKQLDKHNSEAHPERVVFLESNLMANYMKDQSGKNQDFQKHKLKCDSPNCDFTANDQRVLANHRRSHASKGFSCNICGMELKTKQSLSRHSSTHTSNENPVDKSSIPKKKTSAVKASVCDQMDQVYPLNGKHKCSFCGKGFDQLNKLGLHQQTHDKLKSALKKKLKNKQNMEQKRKNAEFLEEEKDAMQQKRKNPEFLEKEKDAKQQKRKNQEFLEKEIKAMQQKRKNPAFLEKEKNAEQQKRKNQEFLEKEKDSKQQKRKNPEFLEKEKDAKQQKRKDKEFLAKEINAKQKKRKNPEFLEREKGAKRQKRKNPEFLEREKGAKQQKRKDKEYLANEIKAMQKKRKNPEFLE